MREMNAAAETAAAKDDDGGENLTPEEIRRTFLRLSRNQIDEQGARPAINALKKIMRRAAAAVGPGPQAVNGKSKS